VCGAVKAHASFAAIAACISKVGVDALVTTMDLDISIEGKIVRGQEDGTARAAAAP
jgi:hypothetical protein